MVWQDWMLTIDGIILTLSMLPAFKKGTRFPLIGSLPTALVMTSMMYVFATLGFVLTAIAVAGQAAMWWFIFFKRRLVTVSETETSLVEGECRWCGVPILSEYGDDLCSACKVI